MMASFSTFHFELSETKCTGRAAIQRCCSICEYIAKTKLKIYRNP